MQKKVMHATTANSDMSKCQKTVVCMGIAKLVIAATASVH
jgi:hypothetical protein